jgi:hypothetical protein
VKPNEAVAFADLVGESFDLFGDGVAWQSWQRNEAVLLLWAEVRSLNLSLGWEALTGVSEELMLEVWMGPWQLSECVSPGACLFWCAHVQQRGFGTTTKCREGEELVSMLPFVRCCWLCQGQDPYPQRYVGTHYVGRDGSGLLAMVPISACGLAVGGATKLVGFVHQIPSKSLCVPPSSKAVVANIVVSLLYKDKSSFGDSQ